MLPPPDTTTNLRYHAQVLQHQILQHLHVTTTTNSTIPPRYYLHATTSNTKLYNTFMLTPPDSLMPLFYQPWDFTVLLCHRHQTLQLLYMTNIFILPPTDSTRRLCCCYISPCFTTQSFTDHVLCICCPPYLLFCAYCSVYCSLTYTHLTLFCICTLCSLVCCTMLLKILYSSCIEQTQFKIHLIFSYSLSVCMYSLPFSSSHRGLRSQKIGLYILPTIYIYIYIVGQYLKARKVI